MEPKEIYRSLIRLHILLEAVRGQIDSTGVVGELHDRGLTANLASVRQSLRTLKSRGYLVSNKVRNSRARTMYSITPAGRLLARDAKKKIRDLVEILG